MKITHILTILAVGLCAVMAHAGWQKNVTNSNGTTPVHIVAAPVGARNRVVTANGGIRVYNNWTNTIRFYLRDVRMPTSNKIEYVELETNQMYISDWVHVLDGSTNTVELTCLEACSNALQVFTHYRDEAK